MKTEETGPTTGFLYMYAQANYLDTIGNSEITIAEGGSLIVSFCNLLSRWKQPPDPGTLNAIFKRRNEFELTPHSLSIYDEQVRVNAGGTGLLNFSDAIVKFNNDIYCAVDRIEGNQIYIIDSRDASIKAPSQYEGVYGQIMSWAAYTYGPRHKSPDGALPFPYAKKRRELAEPTKAYSNPIYAKNRSGHVMIFKPGDYREYQEKQGMLLIGNDEHRYWINPLPERKAIQPVDIYEEPKWRDSVETFAPTTYYVNKNLMVVDFESKRRSLPFERGEPITLYGSFVKNDIVYGRVLIDTDDPTRQYWWYGINEKDLEAPGEDLDYATDVHERKVLNRLSAFDYLTLAHAHLTNLLHYKQYVKRKQ